MDKEAQERMAQWLYAEDDTGWSMCGYKTFEQAPIHIREIYLKRADNLRLYLHSQGIVIKVGGDVDIELADGTRMPGFAKYEPLIKGDK